MGVESDMVDLCGDSQFSYSGGLPFRHTWATALATPASSRVQGTERASQRAQTRACGGADRSWGANGTIHPRE
jgi:hypothetical protein